MFEPLHADPAQHFAALDAFLLQNQALWRAKPFTQLELDWEREHRELSHWLRARSLEQAEQTHNHPETLQAPEPFASLARLSAELSRVAELDERHFATFYEYDNEGRLVRVKKETERGTARRLKHADFVGQRFLKGGEFRG